MGLHNDLHRGRRRRSSDLRRSLGRRSLGKALGLMDSGGNISNSDRTLNLTDNSELNSSSFMKNPDWYKNLEGDSSNEKDCISNSGFFALYEHEPVLPKDTENSDLYQSVDQSKIAKYLDVSSIMVDDEEFRKHLKQQQANKLLDSSDNTEERSIEIPQVLHNKRLQLRKGRNLHLQTERNPFDDVMSDISSECAAQNQNDKARNSSSYVAAFVSDKNNEAEASLEAVLPNKKHILRKRFKNNEISSHGAFDDAFEKSDSSSLTEAKNRSRRSTGTVQHQTSSVEAVTKDAYGSEASFEAVISTKTNILRKRLRTKEISSHGAFDDAFEKSDNRSSSESKDNSGRSSGTADVEVVTQDANRSEASFEAVISNKTNILRKRLRTKEISSHGAFDDAFENSDRSLSESKNSSGSSTETVLQDRMSSPKVPSRVKAVTKDGNQSEASFEAIMSNKTNILKTKLRTREISSPAFEKSDNMSSLDLKQDSQSNTTKVIADQSSIEKSPSVESVTNNGNEDDTPLKDLSNRTHITSLRRSEISSDVVVDGDSEMTDDVFFPGAKNCSERTVAKDQTLSPKPPSRVETVTKDDNRSEASFEAVILNKTNILKTKLRTGEISSPAFEKSDIMSSLDLKRDSQSNIRKVIADQTSIEKSPSVESVSNNGNEDDTPLKDLSNRTHITSLRRSEISSNVVVDGDSEMTDDVFFPGAKNCSERTVAKDQTLSPKPPSRVETVTKDDNRSEASFEAVILNKTSILKTKSRNREISSPGAFNDAFEKSGNMSSSDVKKDSQSNIRKVIADQTSIEKSPSVENVSKNGNKADAPLKDLSIRTHITSQGRSEISSDSEMTDDVLFSGAKNFSERTVAKDRTLSPKPPSRVEAFTKDSNQSEASFEALISNKTNILRRKLTREISSHGAFDDAFEKSDNISSSELQNTIRKSVNTVLVQDQILAQTSSFSEGAVLSHCGDDSLQTHLSEKSIGCYGQKNLTDVQSSNNRDFDGASKPNMSVSKSKDVSQIPFEEADVAGVLEKSVESSLTEPRMESNDQSILVEGSSVSLSKKTGTDIQGSASVFPPTSDCHDILSLVGSSTPCESHSTTDNVTFISNAERSASCTSSLRKMPINKISNYFQTISTDSESSPSSPLRAVDFVSDSASQKFIRNEGRDIQLDVPCFPTKSPHLRKESFSKSAVANHNNTTSNRSIEKISETIDAEKKQRMLKSLFNVKEEIINRKSSSKCTESDCLSLKKPEKKNKEKQMKIGGNYRVPRRKKPRPYVNNNMYAFIERKLALSFGLESRVKAEEFVVIMCSLVDSVIRRKKKYFGLVKELRDKMLQLNLINKQIDFHLFIEKYLPHEFREKAIPCYGSSLGPPSISYEELYKPLK